MIAALSYKLSWSRRVLEILVQEGMLFSEAHLVFKWRIRLSFESLLVADFAAHWGRLIEILSHLHLVVYCEWVLHLLGLERSVDISILTSKLDIRICRRSWNVISIINAGLFTQVTNSDVDSLVVGNLMIWRESWELLWCLVHLHAVARVECWKGVHFVREIQSWLK